MAKFGRGVNREVVAAVNTGELREPLTVHSVRYLVAKRGWTPSPELVLAALENASSDDHNLSYTKYFRAVGRGRYELRDEYRGPDWR